MGWRVKHHQGSIRYRQQVGAIVVAKAGLYVIYSQMYYFDDTTPIMGHYTYINSDKVMESVGSVINDAYRKFSTKYHGGVFRLDVNDRIQVRVPSSHKDYYMGPTYCFFGAYRIGA